MRILICILLAQFILNSVEAGSTQTQTQISSPLNEMILSIEYPNKLSKFIFIHEANSAQGKLQFVVDGHLNKERAMTEKDVQWLSTKIKTFKKDSGPTIKKCESGSMQLLSRYAESSNKLQACVNGSNGLSKELRLLTNALLTYL